MTTEKPSRRRRHDYGPEIADLICERLMDGELLRQICQDRRMPARGRTFPMFSFGYKSMRSLQNTSDSRREFRLRSCWTR